MTSKQKYRPSYHELCDFTEGLNRRMLGPLLVDYIQSISNGNRYSSNGEKFFLLMLFMTLIEQVWEAMFRRKVVRKEVVINLRLSQWIFSQHPIHELNLIKNTASWFYLHVVSAI